MVECPLDFIWRVYRRLLVAPLEFLRGYLWDLSVFQTFEVPDISLKKKGAVSSFERSN